MTDNSSTNRALLRFIYLPTIFLTVALTGGLRVGAESHAFIFVAPPVITLILAVLLMILYMRGGLVELYRWFNSRQPPLTNISHALTLGALFFASAQAFNSVLPESGLLRWMLSFFFLWTLWNNQFATFDARRLLRSLAVLFGTAFILKHILLASLEATDGGWLQRLAGTLLQGVVSGGVRAPEVFAPATGYISFFTLALYVGGLILLLFAPEGEASQVPHNDVVRDYYQLPPAERLPVREAILHDESPERPENPLGASEAVRSNE